MHPDTTNVHELDAGHLTNCNTKQRGTKGSEQYRFPCSELTRMLIFFFFVNVFSCNLRSVMAEMRHAQRQSRLPMEHCIFPRIAKDSAALLPATLRPRSPPPRPPSHRSLRRSPDLHPRRCRRLQLRSSSPSLSGLAGAPGSLPAGCHSRSSARSKPSSEATEPAR